MFFKKKASTGEKNNVKYMNAHIGIKNFSMNVHSYLVDGVLIDTGAHSLHKYFESFIDDADFDQVVITHHHEDHTGCAAYIEETKNVPIYISEKSVETCSKKADYPLYRKIFWGSRKPFHANELGATFTSRTAKWDVIETPGHAFDHLSFLNRQTGQLFTGDLFVQVHTKVLLSDESIPTIIQSLKKVLTYDFNEVFCQHAGFVQDGRMNLKRKLDYLSSVQDEVMTLYKQGYSSKEICQRLFPKKYPIMKFSRGEWDSLHIVTSIINDFGTENRVIRN